MEVVASVQDEVSLAQRWYAPLIHPVEAQVYASLNRLLDMEPHASLWGWPRVGLASAWMVRLSRTYGRRRVRGLSRAGAAAELYNVRQFVGMPNVSQQQRWAKSSTGPFRTLIRTLLSSEQMRAERVLENWLQHPLSVPQAESALLLRAITGWVAIAADISAEEHALLDRLSFWLGLLAEEHLGTDGPWQEEHGAASVGVRRCLSALPDSVLTEDLLACLEMDAIASVPLAVPGPSRVIPQWQPLPPPVSAVGLQSSVLGVRHDALGVRLESVLESVIEEGVYRETGRWLLARGGKRVRPALTLASADACGGAPEDALLAAALVEWLHQASLILDDIMDEAPIRRGSPTLHRATSVSSALGAFVWLLERIRSEARVLSPPMRQVLLSGVRQLVEAQYDELVQTGRPDLSVSSYYRILAGKTASLFGVSVELGALSAGANRKERAAVKEFARSCGLAFQMVDDLLDYTGTIVGFGKAPGTDLRARKVTLPVILLRKSLSDAERDRLDALLAQGHASSSELTWVQESMHTHGVVAQVRERVEAHRLRAERALSRLPDPERVTWLRSLLQACIERIR